MTEQTILSQLRDHLRAEREMSDPAEMDKSLILQARDRVRKCRNIAVDSTDLMEDTAMDEAEAIIETLSDISKLREEKIIMMAQHPEVFRPFNRYQPSEAKLLQDVRSAILIYREAVQP